MTDAPKPEGKPTKEQLLQSFRTAILSAIEIELRNAVRCLTDGFVFKNKDAADTMIKEIIEQSKAKDENLQMAFMTGATFALHKARCFIEEQMVGMEALVPEEIREQMSKQFDQAVQEQIAKETAH